MGMALKTDLTQIKIVKMNQTTTDLLARMLRTRLRSEGVSLNFLVVASTEKPKEKLDGISDPTCRSLLRPEWLRRIMCLNN